jgi:hypothetical protein
LLKVDLRVSNAIACLLLLLGLPRTLLLLLLLWRLWLRGIVLLLLLWLNGWWREGHQVLQLQLLSPLPLAPLLLLLLLQLCGSQARWQLVSSAAEGCQCSLASPLWYAGVPVLCAEQLLGWLCSWLCAPVPSGSSSSCSSSSLDWAGPPGPT